MGKKVIKPVELDYTKALDIEELGGELHSSNQKLNFFNCTNVH